MVFSSAAGRQAPSPGVNTGATAFGRVEGQRGPILLCQRGAWQSRFLFLPERMHVVRVFLSNKTARGFTM